MSHHRPVTPPDPLSPPLSDPSNFSLILGGPLYQLWSRAHLGDIEAHIRRRILVLSGICWLPLLLLCLSILPHKRLCPQRRRSV